MREFKQSILIVCLNDKIGQEISIVLADKLNMLFANSKEIVNYEVFDSKSVIEKCGLEYFEKKELKSLKHISNYENAVVCVDYDYFTKGEEFFKKTCNFVFVRIKKKQLEDDDTINMIAFEERDKELENKCEFVVNNKTKVEKTVNEILNQFRSEK